MLSTPEVLRRTGGRPVKSIVFDEADHRGEGPGAGRRDHRRPIRTASCWSSACSRAASSS